MTQESVIINDTVKERETLFTHLYLEAFPILTKYVAGMGGSFDEAKDVFQDALVIYYEKTRNGAVEVEVSDKSYLLGIARHLYLNKYRFDKKIQPIDTNLNTLPDIYEPKPATNRLLRYLETAGKKCMDLLQAFYYDKKPLTEIAETFGYSGIRSATVQKYKCLEKVRNKVEEKSMAYEDFLD